MARQPSRIGYKFLGSSKNFLYDARETGKTHTTFAYELLLYRAIQNGDITGVDNGDHALSQFRTCHRSYV